jgi:broad specificity phosphatase PhoE
LHDEVKAFISKRSSVQDNKHTGTSITGLEASPFLDDTVVDKGQAFEEIVNSMSGLLPLRILASTMPRALETVSFDEFDIPVSQMSNLNPIDKGDHAGLEMGEIKSEDPVFYSQLQSDPFHTRYVVLCARFRLADKLRMQSLTLTRRSTATHRFPGGESYCDLLRRLNSMVIDIEQQVVPVVVVSHVSTLQCLMAYFRNTNVKKCMLAKVPMHTVIKFEPARGGGWQESWHPLVSKENCPVQMTAATSSSEFSAISAEDTETAEAPIWWGESANTSPTVTPKSPCRKHVANSP